MLLANPPRLVFGEQLGGRSPARLIRVSPDSIYSGHSSSQLLDARFSGYRCYLDYLLIRRTLKQASNSSTD